jgi:Zn-finger protein
MECEGNYEMIKGKNGKAVKDCSNCILPHIESGYDYVMKYLKRKACDEK